VSRLVSSTNISIFVSVGLGSQSPLNPSEPL
jgi:hypothetical protein